MPKPKLATSHPRSKKVIQPIKHAKPVAPPKPALSKPEHMIPVEEDLGLENILKNDAYYSILNDIRGDLNWPQRAFSRFIHARGMDRLNDILLKTLARPMALLVGSLASLASQIITITLAKNYGYSYNYLLFLPAFLAGYLLELIIEYVAIFLSVKFRK